MANHDIPYTIPYRERRVLMIILDFLIINFALLLVLALRPDIPLEPGVMMRSPLWFFILMILWFPIATAFDVYDIGVAGRFYKITMTIVQAGVLTMGIYLLIPFLTPPLPSARWQLFLMLLFPPLP